jgi:outer membrane protein OmpA-like peptidoglycan-associated protein
MTFPRPLLAAGSALAMLAAAGCATDPYTGEQTMNKTGKGAIVGAGGGALIGALAGGSHHTGTGALLGAGIGAIAGTAVGSYMDEQDRRLRQQMAGTGVAVDRRGNEIVLRMPSSITFDSNSYLIQPRFQGTLDQVSQTLGQYPSTYVDVYGHTDSTGGDAINVPLSQNRAKAVADYLAGHGVQPVRIGVRGMAAAMPIASNDTPDGRQQNRRVEIRLTPVTREGGAG